MALNEIDGVVTLDSCQEGVYEEAYVFFTFGETWQDLGTLLQEISTALSERRVGCGYTFRLEWFGSNDRPRAQVVVEPQHAICLADHMQSLASHLTPHKYLSVYGR